MDAERLGESARREGREAVAKAAPWIVWLARLGYVAKGIVFLAVGVLAVRAAFGGNGGPEGSEGALRSLLGEPFGGFVLLVTGVGLLGYALWRFVEAALDPENDGVAKRFFYAVSGLIYGGLALEAIRLFRGRGGSGEDDTAFRAAEVMSWPGGRFIVGLAGLVVLGYGLQQIWKAWSGEFTEKLALGSVGGSARRWSLRISRLGVAARGLAIVIMGVYAVIAGIQHDPSEARGMEGALEALQGSPLGTLSLIVVGVGLFGYGIYCFLNARYRRIRPA